MVSKASTTETIRLDAICTDGGTQARAALSDETITEYAELMQESVEFPPVIVFRNKAGCWLADGFHRYHAAKTIGLPYIECEVRNGNLRDAILCAVGSNAEHGLRRTNEDKHHAIVMLLSDPEWKDKSAGWIAAACNVNPKSVNRVRAQRQEFQPASHTLGLDGKVRKRPSHSKPYVRRADMPADTRRPPTADLKAADFRRATARDLAETLADIIAKHPQPEMVFEALRHELLSRGIVELEGVA